MGSSVGVSEGVGLKLGGGSGVTGGSEGPELGSVLGSVLGLALGDTDGFTEGAADGEAEGDGEGPVIWSEPPLQVPGALPDSYQPEAVLKQLGPASLPELRQKASSWTLSLRIQWASPQS